ncbi:MAG TPA: PEP-CTERM sorting domain-containing protein [Lacipirellulaceae bacterium]
MRFICMLLSTVVALATCAHAYGATLYGATASGSPGRLYVLNSTNGSQVQDVGPLNDVTGLNYPITGLAFHPTTGVLYGSTGNNPVATAGRFVAINPATAQVTAIGPFNAGPVNDSGTPATMTDLAFDSAGNLFGVASIGGPQLYSINIATGQATVIGNSGIASTTGGGLAISSSGVFYGTPTASRFGTYDTTTGVFTNIAAPNRPGNAGALAALDFDPSGVLYAMHSAPGSPPPTNLVTIDPATAMVTLLGSSVIALDAIAFRPDVIPEPGSIVLLLGGALASIIARLRARS